MNCFTHFSEIRLASERIDEGKNSCNGRSWLFGKDPDQRNCIVSNAKIEKTGYKPIYSLGMGIGEVVKGYTMIANTKYGNV
ncbi:MAG: hypothetical protein ACYCTV_09705 [Leptospirales bacterium]